MYLINHDYSIGLPFNAVSDSLEWRHSTHLDNPASLRPYYTIQQKLNICLFLRQILMLLTDVSVLIPNLKSNLLHHVTIL